MPLKTPYLSISTTDTKAFTKTTAMNSFQNSFQINVQKKKRNPKPCYRSSLLFQNAQTLEWCSDHVCAITSMQFREIRIVLEDPPSFPWKKTNHGWPLWSRELTKSQTKNKNSCYVQSKLQWKLTFDQDRRKTDIYWSCSWWHPIKWCQSLVSESAPFPHLVQVLWLTHTNHLPGREVKEISSMILLQFFMMKFKFAWFSSFELKLFENLI